MQTKNTLKFIAILAAVGFFGSLAFSGSSAKQASLPAPTLLAQAGATTSSSAVPGKSFNNSIVFETAADARFDFRLAPGAVSIQYRTQEINPANGSRIGSPRIFPRQPSTFKIPPGDLNKFLPGHYYMIDGSSCSATQCFNTYSAAFYFSIRAGAAPVEAPIVDPSVPPGPYTFFASAPDGIYSWDRVKKGWLLSFRHAPVPVVAPVVPPVAEVAPSRGFAQSIRDGITGAFNAIEKVAIRVVATIFNLFSFDSKDPSPTSTNYNLNINIVGNLANNPGTVVGSVNNQEIINCVKPTGSGPNQGTCTASVAPGDQVTLFSSNLPDSPVGWASSNLNANPSWIDSGCDSTLPICDFTVPTSAQNVQNVNITVHLSDTKTTIRGVIVTSQAGAATTSQPDSFNQLLNCDNSSNLDCSLLFFNPTNSQTPLQVTAPLATNWFWISLEPPSQKVEYYINNVPMYKNNVLNIGPDPNNPPDGMIEISSGQPISPVSTIPSPEINIGGSAFLKFFAVVAEPPSGLRNTGAVTTMRERKSALELRLSQIRTELTERAEAAGFTSRQSVLDLIRRTKLTPAANPSGDNI